MCKFLKREIRARWRTSGEDAKDGVDCSDPSGDGGRLLGLFGDSQGGEEQREWWRVRKKMKAKYHAYLCVIKPLIRFQTSPVSSPTQNQPLLDICPFNLYNFP
ncbi:hypothetical protein L2E82_09101 [Cichorium intybus]|uniref:Uncharacterized protein n=1 Tax=Cichorium intybus TaxID=13427 RepID=A0ACB9G7I9_CICIN|nr:hypothetical protein L2E82_09101 [Cichorium intybus]